MYSCGTHYSFGFPLFSILSELVIEGRIYGWKTDGHWTGRPSYKDKKTHLKRKRKKEMKNVPRGVHQMRLLPRHSLTDVVVLVVIDIVVVGGGHLKFYCPKTSTAGVHQMRLLRRHSLIVVTNVVVVITTRIKKKDAPHRFSDLTT